MQPDSVEIIDLKPPPADYLAEVVESFSKPQKQLPCKLLYDARGSQLFERICELPEYYPTRTELSILRQNADEMAETIGPRCRLVELGSGSSTKIRLLLDALDAPSAYLPVDISRKQLIEAASSIARDYVDLTVVPIVADYTQRLILPEEDGTDHVTCGFFPGSTIGNFSYEDSIEFLIRIRELVDDHGGLLIGFDLKKDRQTLEAAYNDKSGVTAEFNLNILTVINRLLDGNFDISKFAHRATYNEAEERIEMRLYSLEEQNVSISGHTFHLDADEFIITEHSHKFTMEKMDRMAELAGFKRNRIWHDNDRLFAVAYLQSVG